MCNNMVLPTPGWPTNNVNAFSSSQPLTNHGLGFIFSKPVCSIISNSPTGASFRSGCGIGASDGSACATASASKLIGSFLPVSLLKVL